MKKTYQTKNIDKTVALGELVGSRLKGGEVLVLQSDLGGGKTTFVRGLARGFGSTDPVASPTFTLSSVYARKDGKQMHHYDFYRLNDPGILMHELHEIISQEYAVVVIEWASIVKDMLPKNTVYIGLAKEGEEARVITCRYTASLDYLFEDIAQ